MQIAEELVKVAKLLVASPAEKAVEDFLSVWLKKNSTFRNRVFSVGGYPRDKLWGIESNDLDLVVDLPGGDGSKKLTSALYKELGNQVVSRPHQQGKYPIWKITFKDNISFDGRDYRTKGAEIDFADPQKESFPEEHSRQRETSPGTLKEDALRRDFTINTLMENLTTREVIDLTGFGLKDLETGNIRINPDVDWNKILSDDPLRMIRAIRFFLVKPKIQTIGKDMLKAIRRNAKRIRIVSAERIMAELTKIMKVGKMAGAIKLMKATKLLEHILPEVQALRGVKQPAQHHQEGDVYTHTMMVLKNAPSTVEGQMAALLHDIGKPKAQEIMGDAIRFNKHAEAGEKIALEIMKRLKFDRKTSQAVSFIVKSHMRPWAASGVIRKLLEEGNTKQADKLTRRFVQKIIEKSSKETLDAILDLAEADELGRLPQRSTVPDLRKMIDALGPRETEQVLPPPIDGHQIMQLFGIKPGPLIGKINKFLKEMLYSDPDLSPSSAAKAVLEEFSTFSSSEIRDRITKVLGGRP